MYTLYSLPGTCSTGITVLLQHLQQEVEIINPSKMEDYTKISPTKQVPVLDDNGLIITEGAAIALYLLEKHNSPWLSNKLSEKGEFLRWLMFNYATLHPSYAKLFTINNIMAESKEKEIVLQGLADIVSNNWKILDQRLEGKDFIYGDSATIIDYLLCIYTRWNRFFPKQTFVLGDNIQQLVNSVSVLPEFTAAYRSENIEFLS